MSRECDRSATCGKAPGGSASVGGSGSSDSRETEPTRPADLLVVAKSPLPGRSKTRLARTLGPVCAARVAEASLADTLAVVSAAPGFGRRLLALDGPAGPWLPANVEVVAQRGDDLAARLENAWSEVKGPTLQIGMDTPQVTPAQLGTARRRLDALGPRGALLGPATDGGWWLLGLSTPSPGLFDDVPMSTAHTATEQLARLGDLGYEVEVLTPLTDIDVADDLLSVTLVHRPPRLFRLMVELGLLTPSGRPLPAPPHPCTERADFATMGDGDERNPERRKTRTT